jgi:uncharacterized protein
MDTQHIIKKTEEYVRKTLEGEGSGHDWWHVYKVRNLAIELGISENADLYVVELASLLHDIADWKFHSGDESVGPAKAREWLESQQVDEPIICHVCEIIQEISFKGAGVKTPMKTLEGKVVQDADRLDATGAQGISRAFTYGGHKGREIYNPNIKPEHHDTFEQYKSGEGPSINHFYEKLLLLKDLMNTDTGRKIAEGRHQFMEQYLDRFFKEWEGKA